MRTRIAGTGPHAIVRRRLTGALEVRGLAKRYGATQALRGVDLDVADGELVGLLGPNGAGKSTLVKSACGLVRPSAGSVKVCGVPAGSPPARRALGYLAELFRFPGWASADELLALHQRLAGSRRRRGGARALLELVGLSDAAGRRVETMSKGMQQRLGIAQALVGGPRLLLLDEPTSALDPRGRRIVRELLPSCAAAASPCCSTRTCSARSSGSATGWRSSTTASCWPRAARPRSAPSGVEVVTASGPRRFDGAARDEVPAIVERLVAEGSASTRCACCARRSRTPTWRSWRARVTEPERLARRHRRRRVRAARVAAPPRVRGGRGAHAST